MHSQGNANAAGMSDDLGLDSNREKESGKDLLRKLTTSRICYAHLDLLHRLSHLRSALQFNHHTRPTIVVCAGSRGVVGLGLRLYVSSTELFWNHGMSILSGCD